MMSTRIGERSVLTRQPALYWIFTKPKLSSIYRGKVLGLSEISRVACNSGETRTLKILLPFGREGLGTESLWQEEGNFLKLS